jgi:hypothetical protein
MSQHFWWYLSRSTGIVAMVLLCLSMIWGVLLSTRALREVDRPAWLLSLHTWLSGSSLVLVALHVVGLMFDEWVAFGFRDRHRNRGGGVVCAGGGAGHVLSAPSVVSPGLVADSPPQLSAGVRGVVARRLERHRHHQSGLSGDGDDAGDGGRGCVGDPLDHTAPGTTFPPDRTDPRELNPPVQRWPVWSGRSGLAGDCLVWLRGRSRRVSFRGIRRCLRGRLLDRGPSRSSRRTARPPRWG